MYRYVKSDSQKTNYKYYLPEFDIDGTVEEIYADVLHNYITDRDALVATQEILLQNNWGDESKIVGYFIDEIDEEKQYGDAYNVSRMKIDIAQGYLRAGFSDVPVGEYDLDCYVERNNVVIVLTDKTTGVSAADKIPVSQFMTMSRKDFDSWVGQLSYYGDFVDYSEE